MSKIIQKFKIDGMEIIFRYPEANDAAGILKLIDSFVKERVMVGENRKPKLEIIKKSLEERLKGIKNKDVVYLVVEAEEKILGRAWIKKANDQNQEHIGNLVIHLHGNLRGKGLGEKLLRAILKEGKKVLKIKMVTLGVMGKNMLAINLYKKVGFEEYGKLAKGIRHFEKLDDYTLMVKYL
ncbi:MAG: GNAT family N-acetyltransferase [Candidatus Staskawiczbacteria bacterium]|nr:GNAT family N-acetyltransferase [Candidatus Staskawiczbacteria bacterium]